MLTVISISSGSANMGNQRAISRSVRFSFFHACRIKSELDDDASSHHDGHEPRHPSDRQFPICEYAACIDVQYNHVTYFQWKKQVMDDAIEECVGQRAVVMFFLSLGVKVPGRGIRQGIRCTR